MSDFPLSKYYFDVSVNSKKHGQINNIRCYAVDGIGVQYQFKNPGQNANHAGHDLKSLDKTEYSKVTIKRGLYVNSNDKWDKFRKTVFKNESPKKHTKDLLCPSVIISLLSTENNSPLFTWTLTYAYVTSWNFSELNAMESAMMEETIEFEVDTLKIE